MYKRGEYSSAKTMLQQATKLLPKDAEAYYYLGMSSHKLGNKTQGREDLQRAVDLVLPTDLALEATRVLLAPQ
jgi:Flp pilus assembly protein TadD